MHKKEVHSFYTLYLFLHSDPDGIQTHDLQNRNLMLYSAKLLGQLPQMYKKKNTSLVFRPDNS